MKIINPYNYNGKFLKGNLHTHTELSPCGHYSLEKVINLYTSYRMEYDFLAITDHYNLTEIEEFQNRNDIIIFSGVEFKKKDYQTLGINIKEYDDDENTQDNHQEIFDKVNAMGGINIICHPHMNRDEYWPLEKLLVLKNYHGIEIYNNNMRMDNSGKAVATDLWDELLTNGKKVYGFANDDMHIFSRVGGAYNMVLSKEKNKEGILNGLKRGSFYCSFGIDLENISVQDDSIKLEIKDKRIPYVTFRFIGHGGKVLSEVVGQKAQYKVNGNEKYVRVEIKREDGAMAWTQPFYIE